jgi:hypothetical protein
MELVYVTHIYNVFYVSQAAQEARLCVEHDANDNVSRTRWASALIGLGAYADAVSLLKDKPMVRNWF